MGHSHDHSHEHDTDTYYLDQLCLIGLSGAFAGVCLSLYFMRTRTMSMLSLMLAPQFHKFVLWSGVALLVLVVVRAVSLWLAVGQRRNGHADACGHDHAHDDGHAHHHHHEHVHDASRVHGLVVVAAPPALPHEHTHTHEHSHGPAGCGHDHGWAPWRYVILLLPILLFLLGLPSKPPSVAGVAAAVDLTQDAQNYVRLVGLSASPLEPLGLAASLTADNVDGPAKLIGIRELEAAAYDPASRRYWQGQVIRVLGQFSPSSGSDRVFAVVRYRIQCCSADAIPIFVGAVCHESVAGIEPSSWVEVKGRIAFQQTSPGIFATVLQVPRRTNVGPADPDPNPYVQ